MIANGRLLALCAGAVLTVWPAAASAQREPPPPPLFCPDAVYAVRDVPLLPSTDELDAVVVDGDAVALTSGCEPVFARVRVTPEGTKLRARWRRCGDVDHVRLRAKVGPYCQRMRGALTAGDPVTAVSSFYAARCEHDDEAAPQACSSDATPK